MEVDAPLVARLVATQFPRWAALPVRAVVPAGWDHRTFRLGDDMSVRLPRAERYAGQVDKEQRWLPRLAPYLPLAVPVPLALGAPGFGYPWRWSVYRWLDGESAATEPIDDLTRLAASLGRFLTILQRIDPAGGPPPGPHNFFRGGPVATYDRETRDAIAFLDGAIDTDAATEVWEAALEARWHGTPVWVHGDVSAGNLLVQEGVLSAVIDFGCLGVGDPACDLSIAWTLLSGESREAFRAAAPLDRETWVRGRGWALWKALITLAERVETNPPAVGQARRTLDEILGDSGN